MVEPCPNSSETGGLKKTDNHNIVVIIRNVSALYTIYFILFLWISVKTWYVIIYISPQTIP